MDKIFSQEDAERYLRNLGLTVGEDVVRQVVDVARGKVKTSFYRLFAGNKSLGVPPLCGKGTVVKIRTFHVEGKLQPYLDYLDSGGAIQPASDQVLPTGLTATDASQERGETPIRSEQGSPTKRATGSLALHQRNLADALLGEWRVLFPKLPPTPFQMVSAIMEADSHEETPPPPLVLGPTNAHFNYASGIKDLVDLPESNSGQRVGVREWEPKRGDYAKAHLEATPKGTGLLREMERRRKLWWAYLHRCKELRLWLRAEASEETVGIAEPVILLGKATDYGDEWDKRVLVTLGMIEDKTDPERVRYAYSRGPIMVPTKVANIGQLVPFWFGTDPRLLDALNSLADPIYKRQQGNLLFRLWRCVRNGYRLLSKPSESPLEEEIVAFIAKGTCSFCEEEKARALLEERREPSSEETGIPSIRGAGSPRSGASLSDPLRRKARETHMDEVRSLIDGWKGCFAVRSPSGIWWAGPNPFAAIDGHPLFDQLQFHVGTKLWDSYSGVRRDIEAYLELVSQLRQSTQDKAPWGVDLPMVSARNQMGIRETWGWAAFNLALDVAQGLLPLNKLENAYSFASSDSLGFPGTDLIALCAGGYVVLAVPNGVETYRDHHITFVRKLAGSAEAQDLVRRHSNLSKAAATIHKDIDQLLFSRDYVLRRCTFAVCIDAQA